MPPDAVEVGTLIVVQGGERFPLDGPVVSGRSQVNQAHITGESIPVDKEAGDDVFSGTLNGDATLEVKTPKLASATTHATSLRAVRSAGT